MLDPFCGCGTTVHAAQKLNRHWIGIDITHLAISLVKRRLIDAFPMAQFEIHGVPKDLGAARELALGKTNTSSSYGRCRWSKRSHTKAAKRAATPV